MITCLTHAQTETLKGTGSPCDYKFYLVADGPLCRHRIRAKRVFFDNLVHFNFIIIRCIFFLITLISDGFLSWVSWLNLFMENCVGSSFSSYVAPPITPCTDCAWQCHSDCETTCHTWCCCVGWGRNKYRDVHT